MVNMLLSLCMLIACIFSVVGGTKDKDMISYLKKEFSQLREIEDSNTKLLKKMVKALDKEYGGTSTSADTQPKSSGVCKDTKSKCPGYAKKGYCTKKNKMKKMEKFCAKTCHLCGEDKSDSQQDKEQGGKAKSKGAGSDKKESDVLLITTKGLHSYNFKRNTWKKMTVSSQIGAAGVFNHRLYYATKTTMGVFVNSLQPQYEWKGNVTQVLADIHKHSLYAVQDCGDKIEIFNMAESTIGRIQNLEPGANLINIATSQDGRMQVIKRFDNGTMLKEVVFQKEQKKQSFYFKPPTCNTVAYDSYTDLLIMNYAEDNTLVTISEKRELTTLVTLPESVKLQSMIVGEDIILLLTQSSVYVYDRQKKTVNKLPPANLGGSTIVSATIYPEFAI